MAAVADPPNLVRLRELAKTLATDESGLFLFFDASPDLLAIAEPDGSVRRFNRAWQKILGWTDEDLQEQPWTSLIHPEDVESSHRALQSLPLGDQRFICRLFAKDRNYVMVEFTATQLDDCINLIGRPVPTACLSCPETLTTVP